MFGRLSTLDFCSPIPHTPEGQLYTPPPVSPPREFLT